eukprot:2505172-Rhodomonas_salina.2
MQSRTLLVQIVRIWWLILFDSAVCAECLGVWYALSGTPYASCLRQRCTLRLGRTQNDNVSSSVLTHTDNVSSRSSPLRSTALVTLSSTRCAAKSNTKCRIPGTNCTERWLLAFDFAVWLVMC